ncbi:MAG TPA: CYTH domain-containing protein [Vicinamibacterales bacterium]|nr:CYTH domain-containing protein [Vicinamibacterales bacterium]
MSARNVRFKAHFTKGEGVTELLTSIGATFVRSVVQRDTYFATRKGRLKLRDTDGSGELIYYDRLNSPQPRESSYLRTSIPAGRSAMTDVLDAALGSIVVVSKTRTIFDLDGSLMNVDLIEDLGQFIEVEVPIAGNGSADLARQKSARVSASLGLTHGDMIAFSYADLVLMKRESAIWREKLKAVANPGRLFLLDGVSGSGKTSLLYKMLEDKSLGLQCAPRHTTRSKRTGERELEYLFVDAREFHDLVSSGAFIEFRDFEFGMSYGLSWDQSMRPLLAGHDAIGIIDLGNARHVAEVLPEAVRILISTSPRALEGRLRARGHLTEEQIQERLSNAAYADPTSRFYDFVVDNDDGAFERSLSTLRDIIRKGASARANFIPSAQRV